MTDSLSDHLREHCRGWYERVEARHVEASVEGMRRSIDHIPGSDRSITFLERNVP